MPDPRDKCSSKATTATGVASPASRAVGSGVSYTTSVQDLLGRHPELALALEKVGMSPADHSALTLEAVATEVGMPREQLILIVAGSLARGPSADGGGCGGDCSSCGLGDHCEASATEVTA